LSRINNERKLLHLDFETEIDMQRFIKKNLNNNSLAFYQDENSNKIQKLIFEINKIVAQGNKLEQNPEKKLLSQSIGNMNIFY